MRAIVWITLAIAPIVVVLAFQFTFLAYHSHIATWTHRLLILVELLAFFLVWPLALDAQRNFQWPKVWANVNRLTVIPLQLFGPKEARHEARLWLREHAIPLRLCSIPAHPSVTCLTFSQRNRMSNLFKIEVAAFLASRMSTISKGRLESGHNNARPWFQKLNLVEFDRLNSFLMERTSLTTQNLRKLKKQQNGPVSNSFHKASEHAFISKP